MYRFNAMGQGGSMARGTGPLDAKVSGVTIQFKRRANGWRDGCSAASKKVLGFEGGND